MELFYIESFGDDGQPNIKWVEYEVTPKPVGTGDFTVRASDPQTLGAYHPDLIVFWPDTPIVHVDI